MHRNFRSALGAPIGFEAFVEYYKLDRVLFLEKYCAFPVNARRYNVDSVCCHSWRVVDCVNLVRLHPGYYAFFASDVGKLNSNTCDALILSILLARLLSILYNRAYKVILMGFETSVNIEFTFLARYRSSNRFRLALVLEHEASRHTPGLRITEVLDAPEQRCELVARMLLRLFFSMAKWARVFIENSNAGESWEKSIIRTKENSFRYFILL